jgi:hypothetical protein
MSSRAEVGADVNAPASPPLRKPSVAARVAAAALIFALVEAAVFHSGFYSSLAQPDSSAGRLQTALYNERQREIGTPRKAGGLMSWAASKAVGHKSRRRAEARLW